MKIWKGKGKRHLPAAVMESIDRMDQEQANRFLKSKGYLVGNLPNPLLLRKDAVDLAVAISDSFSPDFRRYFVASEDSDNYNACFSIIHYMYQSYNIQMPDIIRAFAAIPEVWKEFLRIAANHVNVLLTFDPEGDLFP